MTPPIIELTKELQAKQTKALPRKHDWTLDTPCTICGRRYGQWLGEDCNNDEQLAYFTALEESAPHLLSAMLIMYEALESMSTFKGNMHCCRDCHGEAGEQLATQAKEALSKIHSLPISQ